VYNMHNIVEKHFYIFEFMRSPPCFGRHVKPLVPVAFAIVSTHSSFKEGGRQAAGRKNNCRIFITT
jgi:hypothetical protein